MDRPDDYLKPLGPLRPPRRNNFYFAKLMDVAQFRTEQAYGMRHRWLTNRLGLGDGVLCGLVVEKQGAELCVSAGVAVDTLGREVIVPVRMCLDPWKADGPCGTPGEDRSRTEKHLVYLSVCYHECLTDFLPTHITDCNAKPACEPGTVVESFRFRVTDGAPPERPPLLPEEVCKKVFHTDPPPDDRHRTLCESLPGPCPSPDECPCVVLATVELLPDGTIGTIDNCGPRRRLYSNAMLLELILCLAERVDECCGKHPDPPPDDNPPPPPPPPPDDNPPPAERPFFITGMSFWNSAGLVKTVSDPTVPTSLRANDHYSIIRFEFNQPYDPVSVKAGTTLPPDPFSLLVKGGPFPGGVVPGVVRAVPGRPDAVEFVVRFAEAAWFRPDRYSVTLFGTPDGRGLRPVVRAAAPPQPPLNGEPKPPGPFPTGGGPATGSDFQHDFSVD